MTIGHSEPRSVELGPVETENLLAEINSRRRRRNFFQSNPIHAPPIQAPVGNIAPDARECQGGKRRYKENILEFAERSGCDTIITLSCHQDIPYDRLKSFIKNVIHGAQNKYAKRRMIFVHMTFFIERVPGNTHVHGLITFPNVELRERFWKIFPLTDARSKAERRAQRLAEFAADEDSNKGEFIEIEDNKSPYWTRICPSGTYDLQVMSDKNSAISYAQKQQDRNIDYDAVLNSTDFVTSGSARTKPKARYRKIVK